MKIIASTFALASLATSALAFPFPGFGCLSQQQANTLVQRYSDVIAQRSSDIGNASFTANYITNSDYSEQSDSANIQIGIPLGALTTPSKEAFIEGSQNNPPSIQNTIAIIVGNCHYITWQWINTQFGDGQYEVKGFHLFQVGDNGKLDKTFFEFNSIAGALDIGFEVKYANGSELVVAT